jgi:hypothetical protein
VVSPSVGGRGRRGARGPLPPCQVSLAGLRRRAWRLAAWVRRHRAAQRALERTGGSLASSPRAPRASAAGALATLPHQAAPPGLADVGPLARRPRQWPGAGTASCPPWGGNRARTAAAPLPPPSAPQGASGRAPAPLRFPRATASCHPQPPQGGLCWGALCVRWVAVLALQAPTSPSTGCGRRPGSASRPPPTPALAPSSRSSRKPRAASVRCGRRQRSRCPQGRPGGRGTPSPARRNESIAARRAPAVKAALATLGAPRPWQRPPSRWSGAAAWPPKRAGAAGGLHRWRSRWSRRGSLPARYPARLAAGASRHRRGFARAPPRRGRGWRRRGRLGLRGQRCYVIPGAHEIINTGP